MRQICIYMNMCTSLIIISTTYFTADIKAIIRCDREMVFCFLTCRNEVVCCWQQGERSRWLTGYRPASEGKATGWSCVHVVRSGCDAVVHCSLWYWITKRQHLESQKRLVNKLHTKKTDQLSFLDYLIWNSFCYQVSFKRNSLILHIRVCLQEVLLLMWKSLDLGRN